MREITKNNLNNFIKFYHNFHDSYITNINYDVYKTEIELLIDICWSGNPLLNDDNTYETNKTKIIMILKDIKQVNIKELFSWDYINNVFINYIELENDEFICFADNESEPLIYIVCKKILYEDFKEKW